MFYHYSDESKIYYNPPPKNSPPRLYANDGLLSASERRLRNRRVPNGMNGGVRS